MTLPPFIESAQRVSLMGELNVPYVQLGAEPERYDLNNQHRLNELKAALKALGKFHADPLLSPADPAIETIWQSITIDDGCVDPNDLSCGTGWDPAAADEFALALSRYRTLWGIAGPLAHVSAGGLQPTATGLEVIAGAVNELLGGYPKMALYEKWRAGVFAPPSKVSSPSPEDPVRALNFFGPTYRRAPPEVLQDDQELYSRLYAAEKAQADAWVAAIAAKNEPERMAWQQAMIATRNVRNDIVDEAIAKAKARQGEIIVDQETVAACLQMGGQWDPASRSCRATPPLRADGKTAAASVSLPTSVSTTGLVAIGGLLAAGVYFYRSRKKP